MSYELCYTSLPQGLRPGATGFCTVAVTAGTPAILVERLEMLSGYRPLFPAGSAQASHNPVSWSHSRIVAGSIGYSVLSRVCFAGLDYTQRSNKFAHHVALTAGEQPACGPAWLLAHGNFMRTAWSGGPTEYRSGPSVPSDCTTMAAPCRAWAEAAGDAGWAGVLVEAFLNSPATPAYVIYPPRLDVLPLIYEALALAPVEQRWQVTFNTYFSDLAAGTTCTWRCCAAGSPAAQEARRSKGVVLDLTTALAAAPKRKWTEAAHIGSIHAEWDADPSSPSPLLDMGDNELDPLPLSPQVFTSTPIRATDSSVRPRQNQVLPRAVAAHGQTWTPPVDVTRLEAPEPTPVRSRAGWPMRLLVMTIWGGIVATALLLIMQNRASEQLTQSSGQFADRIAKLEERIAADGEQLAQAKRDLEDQSKANAARLDSETQAALDKGRKGPDTTRWMRITEMEAAIEERVQRRLKADAFANPEPLRPRPVTLPAATPAPAASQNQIVLTIPESMRLVPGAPLHICPVDDFPAASPPDKPLLLGLLNGGGNNMRCRLIIVKMPDALKICTYNEETNTLSRPNLSGSGDIPLCSFQIEGNGLYLNWPALKKDQDDKVRRAFLRNCLLKVSGETNGESAIQFVRVVEMEFSMASTASLPLDLSSDTATARELFVVSGRTNSPAEIASGHWETTGGAASYVLLGGPTIRFTLETKGVSCNYSVALKVARDDLRDKQKGMDTWKVGLPLQKSGDVDWEKLRDAGIKSTKDAYDQKNDAVAHAEKVVRSLEMVPAPKLLVRLNNGVILYKISVAGN